ncbi:MAG: c-type cytochrome, partial [Epsilonproteobacteria bacterium]|nr:c-type cytochrome [Campylobacterota bacterium]
IDFVKDYVINPSASKSFCDKESLKIYGVMPSQKGLLSEDELDAIVRYMFEHFTQKNLLKEQALQRKLQLMPKGQKLAIKNNCLGCHRVDKDLVGPSFKHILKRNKDNLEEIYKSIKDGSIKKYKSSRGAKMPSFKNLSDEDIKSIINWMKKSQ